MDIHGGFHVTARTRNTGGGANLATGGCTCGLTGSCADDESLKCNCDKNDENWREDSSFLTIKSHLPVKQLRFGETGQAKFREEGYLRKTRVLWPDWCRQN